MIAAAWIGVAGAVGFAARAIGRGARDLDPHHKRDGVGLLTLGAAIVLAAGLWFRMPNAAGRSIRTVAVGGFGSLAWVLPVLGLLLAWRFLRHPDRNTETIRASIGWTALLLGAVGLIHIAKGTPRPSDGARAMHLAGGYLGYAVSGPLASTLTTWAAVALLTLLSTYGLLLISGTTVHRIPERLRDLRMMFGHGRPQADPGDELEIDEDYEAGSGAVRRVRGQLARQIRLRPAIEGGDHSKPYDTPLLEQDAKRGKRRPDGTDGLIEALGFGTDEEPRPAAAAAAPHEPEPAIAVPKPSAPLRNPEQLTLSSGDAIAYTLPPTALLRPGTRAEAADQGERHRGGGAVRGARAVPGGRAGDRVQPGPDGDQVRDRARPGGQGGAGHRAEQEHLLRGQERRRADHLADPGQVRDRGGDPERRQGGRQPGRRAQVAGRARRPSPDGGRPGQGRRGPGDGGEPGQDAAHPDRRSHRIGQVRLPEQPDHLDPDPGHAGRGADDPDRPQAGRADHLRGHPAPDHADHHQPEEGGRGAGLGGRRDGAPLRRPVRLRVPARGRLQQGGAGRAAQAAAGQRTGLPALPVPAGDRGRAVRPDDGGPARRRGRRGAHHPAGPGGRHPPGAGHPAARRWTW